VAFDFFSVLDAPVQIAEDLFLKPQIGAEVASAINDSALHGKTLTTQLRIA
jgi:hypothetical protein